MSSFEYIEINDFRALKNQKIVLGKYVTMLAGWNATGKSTVLALLANSTESRENAHYSGRIFRAKFDEILKGNREFDKTQADRLTVSCSSSCRIFRTAWQIIRSRVREETYERFRVIPKDPDTEKENKFPNPVIYLGLSRLFPIGEMDDKNSPTNTVEFRNEDDAKWFSEKYNHIISKSESIKEITKVDVKAAKKDKWGISTDSYGWQANSAGQDNVSQILCSLLSFHALKDDLGDEYDGGLFLVDELDAALHPKAQQKMLDLLIKEARELNIQVVFTTHSLTLIKYFYSKRNDNDKKNILSYYFTYENDVVNVFSNYSFEQIEQDTLLPLVEEIKNTEKITLYAEDDEARWLLKKLLANATRTIDFRKVAIGCASLVDLMNCESCFHDYIVVFDGDMKESNKARIKRNRENMIILPSTVDKKTSPEELLHDFIESQSAEEYLSQAAETTGGRIKLEYFRENDLSQEGSKKNREHYKDWFKKHKSTFEKTKLFDFWKAANADIVNQFQEDFIKIYNKIAQRKGFGFTLKKSGSKLKKSSS